MIGRSRRRAASSSIRSSRPRSDQWMSSKTSSIGWSRATDSMKQRTEKNSSSRSSTVPSESSPSRIARWRATSPASAPEGRSATCSRSFVSATSGGSLSKIPQSCLTCIAKAKYALLSRYGSERPWTERPPSPSTMRSNSWVRRRLADPGRADHRHQVRDTLAGDPLPDSTQHLELAGAADELARVLPLAGGMPGSQRDPGLDRSGLALRLDRLGRLVLDRVLRGRVRLGADDDAVHGRGALQPRGGVDHVARDQRLAECRSRAERDERLAGVHGDAQLQVEVELALVELERAVTHRQRAANGALGVVAVGRGRAEDGHDRVADELLHGAAEGLELAPDVLVVRRRGPPARPRGRASRRGR